MDRIEYPHNDIRFIPIFGLIVLAPSAMIPIRFGAVYFFVVGFAITMYLFVRASEIDRQIKAGE